MIAVRVLLWLAYWLLVCGIAWIASIAVSLPLTGISAGIASLSVAVAVIWGGYLAAPQPWKGRRP